MYTEILFGMGCGLFLFICSIKSYTIGIAHGKELSKGNVPKIELNPVKAVTKAVEEHKEKEEQKALNEELSDIMSCSMESMLKAVKKER